MIRKVVSGGQTGVDRAALDVALEAGIPCGGWCPLGRRAEDGTLDPRYPLRETPVSAYSQRTEWNVRDADATLVLHRGPLCGGTALTVRLAQRLEKLLLVVDLDGDPPRPEIGDWLEIHSVQILNVAGPRESSSPGIYDLTTHMLRPLFRNTP